MPLYGGAPYYSPDDITIDLDRISDTVEIPKFQSFWEKWRLWIAGAAILVGATTGTLIGVASVHTCCSKPPVPPASTAPVAPAPVPITIPTTTRTKCPTCNVTPSRTSRTARPSSTPSH